MDGIAGLRVWQWIFLLEGLPIIPLGFITYFFLGSLPDTVQCEFIKVDLVNLFSILISSKG